MWTFIQDQILGMKWLNGLIKKLLSAFGQETAVAFGNFKLKHRKIAVERRIVFGRYILVIQLVSAKLHLIETAVNLIRKTAHARKFRTVAAEQGEYHFQQIFVEIRIIGFELLESHFVCRFFA